MILQEDRTGKCLGVTPGVKRLRLLCLQAQPADSDDPTGGYMLQAGARICKSLGEEFLPYLNIVMPPLLRSAQLKPDVKVTSADSDEDEEENEDDVSPDTLTQCCFPAVAPDVVLSGLGKDHAKHHQHLPFKIICRLCVQLPQMSRVLIAVTAPTAPHEEQQCACACKSTAYHCTRKSCLARETAGRL